MADLVHLAIIMDGNGRWAKARFLPRTAGHLEGLKALKRCISGCISEGIRYLTVYCFSTENWKRPPDEVKYLMALFTNKIYGEIKTLNSLGVSVRLLGNTSNLPPEAVKNLKKAEEETKDNDKITLQLAINYGGYDEIERAVNSLIRDGYKEIDASLIRSRFDNPDIPPVDFIVRSAGEMRLSKFLLFDSAYAELGFYDKLFPDWDEQMIHQIKEDYYKRIRKFGGLA